MKAIFRFLFLIFIILINYQFCNAQRIIPVVGNKFTVVRNQKPDLFFDFVLITNFPQNASLTFQMDNTGANNATVIIDQLMCSVDSQVTTYNATRFTPIQFLYNGVVSVTTTVSIPLSNNAQIVATGALPCAVVALQYHTTGIGQALIDITGFINTNFIPAVTSAGAIAQSPSGGIPVTVVGGGVVGQPAVTSGTTAVSGSDGTFERRIFANAIGSLRITTPQNGGQDGISNTLANGPWNADGGNSLISNSNYWYNGFASAGWDRAFYCSQTAILNALGAATTQIVALSGSTKIRVCSVMLENNNATATSVKLVEGTGANCGTGTTNLTGNWFLTSNAVGGSAFRNITLGNTGAYITKTAGDALCVTSSAAGAVDVTISYTQF